jgi:hypothetical protein
MDQVLNADDVELAQVLQRKGITFVREQKELQQFFPR